MRYGWVKFWKSTKVSSVCSPYFSSFPRRSITVVWRFAWAKPPSCFFRVTLPIRLLPCRVLLIGEHGGDGDNRWMAEPGEDAINVDYAWNRDCEEGQNRNDVIAPSALNKEAQRRAQNAKYIRLFKCHCACSFSGKLFDGQFSG
jgi:hypothetical protein